MDVRKLYLSNGSKQILGVKWVKMYFRCEMGLKIFLMSNGSKKVLGVKQL